MRPPSLTSLQRRLAWYGYRAGESVNAMAKLWGVSRQTVIRAIQEVERERGEAARTRERIEGAVA